MSTVLGPRTKLTLFKNREESTNAIDKVKEQMVFYISTPPLPTNTKNQSNSTKDYFRQLRSQQTGSTFQQSNQTYNNELERYLALEYNDEISSLTWWKAHSVEFPVLSQIARDFLAIQATSVASEKTFSVASNTLTKIRNRFHSKTARATLCLKS